MSTPDSLRESILRAMTVELAGRDEWDVAPELWRVSLRDGEPVLSQISVPDYLWTLARPPDVLEEIARAATIAGYYPGQQDDEWFGSLFGFGYLYEGWAIKTDRTCGDTEQAHADAKAHRIHTRPDRVEIRTFTAVDRDGTTYHVMKSRTGELDEAGFYPAGDEASVGGVIVDALDQLTKGLAR